MHIKVVLTEMLYADTNPDLPFDWDHGELGSINENGVTMKSSLFDELRGYPMSHIKSIRFDHD